MPHKSSDVVVIIVLPIPGREIWRCRKSGGDINEDIVSKFYSSIGTIRPRYIKGYFIVETGIFVSNPKFSPEFPQKPFIRNSTAKRKEITEQLSFPPPPPNLFAIQPWLEHRLKSP